MQKAKIFELNIGSLSEKKRLKAQAELEKFINNYKIINFDSARYGNYIAYTFIYDKQEAL